MAIPTSAQEYYFSEIGSYENLVLGSKTVEQPKANDVLVKVHAVSLQYRDLQIAIGAYAVS
ncbi:hypothetical protein DXG03_004012 [Asterophora parasitica]|uniref:Uncharacterized protein n=1 Tax=Asterophora parasitica TaxID=117018 RepID=A0A9P7G726_9AGAR|nr:hypothetical protein DXG03_004012 [Asterophora parasitica]